MNIKDIMDFKITRFNNSDALDSKIFNGFVFEGFVLNDRMKAETSGKVAVLDFPVNWKMDNFSVTNAKDMEEVQNKDSEYKKKIVDRLKELGVECVFYTDTTPEFESYLTENGISGIVVFARENIDGICQATKCIAASSLEQLNENHIGSGKMRYEKPRSGRGHIWVDGDMQTIVLKGNTQQLLEEMIRAIDDVLGLLRNDLEYCIGAGAIEIEIANDLREFAKQVGGKEQLAILKFAESIESIPQIIAENSGLDAIEIITTLSTLHQNGEKDMGVDVGIGISNARERGIFEPVLIKIHAINSATNITTLILKIDKVLLGQLK